jgi:polysaccharide export outer membrane protein
MFRRLPLLAVIWLAVSAIPVRAQDDASPKKPVQPAVPAMSSADAKKPATADPNYVIGDQDVLDVSVWKEPEVSRVVPVRPDGKISLPLLNDVQAAGLTPAQLAAEITESLKKYVTSPQVTVIVTTINSQRVYILGEVTRPGAFPLLPGMSVLQALSSAGGFTQFAKVKNIFVRRVENGKESKYPFNYKDVINGKRPEQDILLKAGDTIVVP